MTDQYSYNALGQRMRAQLEGTWYRYIYAGDRVVEETNDAGGTLARYTTESGSYYEPMWHLAEMYVLRPRETAVWAGPWRSTAAHVASS